MGMPRRYYDYLPEFGFLNQLSTIGSWILVLGLIIMIVNLINSYRKGEKASMNPWGGVTFEWTIKSPPPLHNFDKIPEVSENGPYDFSNADE